MRNLEAILVDHWYNQKTWGWVLWPFMQVFQLLVKLRIWAYTKNFLPSFKADVPIIVIGNLTVGGTGKTPLVIHLAQLLQHQGLQPGIVLRGYRSNAVGAILVHANSEPKLVGDEAVLLARRCTCPVVVAKNRVQGVKKLQKMQNVNIILCDDGLQHYALQRDLEIVVIDGERGFGNGFCLPMGPLREKPERLEQVHLQIVHGTDMQLISNDAYSLLNNKRIQSLKAFAGKTAHAIAGIGTPQKFFKQLDEYGITVIPHAYPDHHEFKKQQVCFPDKLPIFMTEKDAVKCKYFATEQHWVVPVSTVLADHIQDQFLKLVMSLRKQETNHGG